MPQKPVDSTLAIMLGSSPLVGVLVLVVREDAVLGVVRDVRALLDAARVAHAVAVEVTQQRVRARRVDALAGRERVVGEERGAGARHLLRAASIEACPPSPLFWSAGWGPLSPTPLTSVADDLLYSFSLSPRW